MSAKPAALGAAPIHAGRLLACLRSARGWTRPQLARLLGWQAAWLAGVEAGRKPVSRQQLEAAVQALGLQRWTLQFAEDYLRAGGQAPQGAEDDPRWRGFVLGLETMRLLDRFLRNVPDGRQARAEVA